MLRLIISRLLISIVTLLGVSIVIFAGTEVLPGDIAQIILGTNATPEGLAAIRDNLGLNEPAHIRYFEWLWNFVRGDFGSSLAANAFGNASSINQEIALRLGNTVALAGAAVLLAAIPGILLGVFAAIRPKHLINRVVNTTSVISVSLPDFFIAYVFIAVFSVQLGIFPSVSNVNADMHLAERLHRMALPVLTLVVINFAYILRLTRATIADILSRPYIEMAVLKGLPTWRIVMQHALPNGLGPLANIVALSFAILIVGTVVLEVVFVYPGMGRYMVDAVSRRDVPVVQACSMIFASFFVGLNFLADLFAILVNPRLRYPK
ncbi:ABC transporter permease [Roseovarius indicus]|uniref:ABC transporter permease n=1 Tax=Roseovarius indicus TaxID=540747 RepID=UPI0032EC9676